MGSKIEVGGRYRHRNGNVYRVTRYLPGKYRTKDADSGNWHDAVEYAEDECSVGEPMIFVRNEADFEAKFERVETE